MDGACGGGMICLEGEVWLCMTVLILARCGCWFFFFQAEDGIRDLVRSRGLGDVYKRQGHHIPNWPASRLPPVRAGLTDLDEASRWRGGLRPVSYTHLTLPTIYSV